MLSPHGSLMDWIAGAFSNLAYAFGAWAAWWILVKKGWLRRLLGIADARGSAKSARLVTWGIAVTGLVAAIAWLGVATTSLWWILTRGLSSTVQYSQTNMWLDQAMWLATSIGMWLFTFLPALLFVLFAWRLNWARIEEAAGRSLPIWLRVTALLVAAPMFLWPVELVSYAGSIWTWIASAGSQASATGAFPGTSGPGTLWQGPGGRAMLLSNLVFPIVMLVALAYAFMVARGIVWWFDGAHRRFFRDGGRLPDIVVIVGLTGVLAAGLEFVLGILYSVSMRAVLWAAEPAGQGFGADSVTYQAPQNAVWHVAWQALPLVAIPIAIWMMRAVDWQLVENRLEWFPSAREKRLLVLGVAGLVSWPFSALVALSARLPSLPTPSATVGLALFVLVVIALAVIDSRRRHG